MSVKEKLKTQPINFWEKDGFRADLERIQNDVDHATLLTKCIQERATIEGEYARKLSKWKDTYSHQFKKTTMYGTHEGACEQVLDATQPVIRIHEHMAKALVNQCVTETNDWKKNAYKTKVFGGYKEQEDLEKDFAKAQRKWLKINEKMIIQKKAYHKISSQHKQDNAEQAGKDSDAKSAELKLAEEKYRNLLVEVEQMAPIYVGDMKRVHKKSQTFAQRKIEFIATLFRDYVGITDLSKYDQKLVEQTQLGGDAVNSINVAADLETWNTKINFEKDLVLPDFEDFDEMEQNGIDNGNANNNNGTVRSTKSIRIEDPGLEPVRKTSTKETRRHSFDGSSSVKVYALYDYVPKADGELELKAGMQFMRLTEADAQGWCEGLTDDGTKGHFPSQYASVVP